MEHDEADLLLIEQVRQGDAQAWQTVISQYEGRLLSFVDSRLRNRATSEDVVQEAFMGFLISLPNYDTRTRLETWLFSIAAHKLTDVLRREGRRPTIPLLLANSQGGSAEPAGKQRPASSLVRSKERRGGEEGVLRECLQKLVRGWQERSEYERLQCMELLFVLGWANKEVARRMNISEQAVANHKHFVVSKLKEAAERVQMRDVDWGSLGIR
jgi:RNA polymerase sigma-70 factor (ECF subfamily)